MGWFKRTVVWVVTASILNTLGLPLVHAQMAQRNQQAMQQSQQDTAADQYAELLDYLVKTLNPETGNSGAARSPRPRRRWALQPARWLAHPGTALPNQPVPSWR